MALAKHHSKLELNLNSPTNDNYIFLNPPHYLKNQITKNNYKTQQYHKYTKNNQLIHFSTNNALLDKINEALNDKITKKMTKIAKKHL